jgi:hypothetical protein
MPPKRLVDDRDFPNNPANQHSAKRSKTAADNPWSTDSNQSPAEHDSSSHDGVSFLRNLSNPHPPWEDLRKRLEIEYNGDNTSFVAIGEITLPISITHLM